MTPLPVPLRGRPRDPSRSRRILEAAVEHFDAHGVERASVDAIAATAGVSKMTVYSHFASKEALFGAAVQSRTDAVTAALRAADGLDAARPAEALASVGQRFLALVREAHSLGHLRALCRAAATHPGLGQAFYRQGPHRLIGELAAYLRRAHKAGSLRVPHPRRAADLFLAMFLGEAHIRGLLLLDGPDEQEDRALLREAVRVFLRAYAPIP